MRRNIRRCDKLIRRHARIATAFLALAAIACGGDSTAPQVDVYAQAAGTYALVSLNGRALPATVFQDATIRTDITSASLDPARRSHIHRDDRRGEYPGDVAATGTRRCTTARLLSLGPRRRLQSLRPVDFPRSRLVVRCTGNVLTYTDENATYRYEKR